MRQLNPMRRHYEAFVWDINAWTVILLEIIFCFSCFIGKILNSPRFIVFTVEFCDFVFLFFTCFWAIPSSSTSLRDRRDGVVTFRGSLFARLPRQRLRRVAGSSVRRRRPSPLHITIAIAWERLSSGFTLID